VTVYVIGLDGLDKEILTESRLAQVLGENGMRVRGLESTTPPITVPAWACGFSGLEPDQVDTISFQELDFDNKEFVQANRKKFDRHGYWNHSRGSSALFDVPGTVEPDVDGCCVSGVFDYGELNSVPGGLAERIRSEVGPPDMDFGVGEEESRREAKEAFRYRWKIFEWLLENRDEEVYFPVFRLTDTMMHSTDSGEDMLEAYDLVADKLSVFFDREVDEGDDVLVVSDHGAVKAEKRFYVNRWLEDNGFLVREDKAHNSVLRRLALRLADVGHRLGVRDLMVRINRRAQGMGADDLGPRKTEVMNSVDWSSTEAFAHFADVSAFSGIWLNDDRLSGVVTDRNRTKKRIVDGLENRPEVAHVHDSRTLYEDPPTHFPDLVLELKESSKASVGFHPKTISDVEGYMHRKQGVIASTAELEQRDLRLVDLGPTVLHMLNQPAPDLMQGTSMVVDGQDTESEDIAGIEF
jgi:predicted AlkP superfamily phosphohydrolase/phosphomutase